MLFVSLLVRRLHYSTAAPFLTTRKRDALVSWLVSTCPTLSHTLPKPIFCRFPITSILRFIYNLTLQKGTCWYGRVSSSSATGCQKSFEVPGAYSCLSFHPKGLSAEILGLYPDSLMSFNLGTDHSSTR